MAISKLKPILLKCPKRGCWKKQMIERDDAMPEKTAVVLQPCDKHEENGYLDLQITYLDKDGKVIQDWED